MLEDEHDISLKLKDECEAVAQIKSFVQFWLIFLFLAFNHAHIKQSARDILL